FLSHQSKGAAMRYRITGTDQMTRQAIDTTITAPSLESAGEIAKKKFIDFDSIEPVEEALPLNYSAPPMQRRATTYRTPQMYQSVFIAAMVISVFGWLSIAGTLGLLLILILGIGSGGGLLLIPMLPVLALGIIGGILQIGM